MTSLYFNDTDQNLRFCASYYAHAIVISFQSHFCKGCVELMVEVLMIFEVIVRL